VVLSCGYNAKEVLLLVLVCEVKVRDGSHIAGYWAFVVGCRAQSMMSSTYFFILNGLSSTIDLKKFIDFYD